MKYDLLYTWLGLPERTWPPDPYRLLGIAPGESDIARIEQCVHERLCRLRGYQVSHPEEATEGMNCLAQAFILITDSLSREMCKKAMPVTIAVAQLPSARADKPPVKPSLGVAARDDTAVRRKTQVDWREAPPPVRIPPELTETPSDASRIHDTLNCHPSALSETVSEGQSLVIPSPAADADVASPPSPPRDISIELARDSSEARKGLATLPGLLQRVTQTRALSRAWKQVGKYIRNPERRLCRAADETDLARRMDYLFDVMDEYPGFVGHPGKPGYRVAAMAKLEKTAHMFKGLDLHQREELARDWEAGQKVIREHHRFLLERLKAMKARGWLEKSAAALTGFARDHFPWLTLASSCALAAAIYFLTR